MSDASKNLVCSPENVREFNAALRSEVPEAHDLAKALRERGMIDGLRGMRIGPLGALNHPGEAAVVPQTSAAAETRIADLWWSRRRGGAR